MILINEIRNICIKLFRVVWFIESFLSYISLIFIYFGFDLVISIPILYYIVGSVSLHLTLIMFCDGSGMPCLSPKSDNYQSFIFFATLICSILIIFNIKNF